jgi:hypothetical protein
MPQRRTLGWLLFVECGEVKTDSLASVFVSCSLFAGLMSLWTDSLSLLEVYRIVPHILENFYGTLTLPGETLAMEPFTVSDCLCHGRIRV